MLKVDSTNEISCLSYYVNVFFIRLYCLHEISTDIPVMMLQIMVGEKREVCVLITTHYSGFCVIILPCKLWKILLIAI